VLRAAAYGAVGPGSGGELGRGGLDAGGAGWRRGGDVRAAPDRRETAPTPSMGPSAGATGTGICVERMSSGKSERVIPGVALAWLGS